VNNRQIAIVGFGAIGQAFHNILKESASSIHIFSSKEYSSEDNLTYHYRITYDSIEESLSRGASEALKRVDSFDLIIVTTGLLHTASILPERSVKDLSADKLLALFAANTIVPAAALKYLAPHLSKDRKSICATLSARIGSISDNRLGGWYSYRASKAALNMLIKCAAIEISRRNKQSIVVGLHPGTVDSNLSKPFQSGVPKGKLFTPHYSASCLVTVLANLQTEDSGKCFDYNGFQILP